MKIKGPLPCIVCGKQLEGPGCLLGSEGVGQNQPSEALALQSPGFFGCTVFDPCDGKTYIELNVCDQCLVKSAQENRVAIGQKDEIDLEYWDPEAA